MPGFGTTEKTKNNASVLAKTLGCTLLEIPIEKAMLQHFSDIGQKIDNHDIAYEKDVYVTTVGSTTHAAALVARGEFVASVFVGAKGKNVDIAAAKVIVEEAGGKVTDLFGREQRYDQDIRGAIVSNGVVHEELVQAMKELEENVNKQG